MDFAALSPAIAAAAAAALLGIFAPLFLVPLPIACEVPPSYASALVGGDTFLEKPETIRVSIDREGAVFVGPNRVPASELLDSLILIRQHRARHVPIELNVHPQAKLGHLVPVFNAIRAAGHESYFVFSVERPILKLSARSAA